jgi:hypothetical protein
MAARQGTANLVRPIRRALIVRGNVVVFVFDRRAQARAALADLR